MRNGPEVRSHLGAVPHSSLLAPISHFSLLTPHALINHSTPLIAASHHAIVPVCRVETGGARTLDGGGAAVVDEERQLQVAVVFIDQGPKVPEADAKVGLAIVELLPGDALLEVAGGGRHQLREADGAYRTRRLLIELALDTDQTERELRLQPFGQRDVVDGRGDVGRDAIARREGEELVGPVELGLRQLKLTPRGVQLLAKTLRFPGKAERKGASRGGAALHRLSAQQQRHGADGASHEHLAPPPNLGLAALEIASVYVASFLSHRAPIQRVGRRGSRKTPPAAANKSNGCASRRLRPFPLSRSSTGLLREADTGDDHALI